MSHEELALVEETIRLPALLESTTEKEMQILSYYNDSTCKVLRIIEIMISISFHVVPLLNVMQTPALQMCFGA